MGYIDKTLGNNEKVLYRARIHSLFYVRVWAMFIVLAAFIVWLKLRFGGQIGTTFTLVLIILWALFCLRSIIPLWTLEIALTNVRIVMKRGLIVRSTHELELKAIEEVNLRQSMLGRVLNYGTVDVRGIGDVDDIILNGISDPLTFRKEVASAVERVGKNGGSMPGRGKHGPAGGESGA